MNLISVDNLHKSYGSVQALKGISFDVPKESIYGFLGPNGAGKSTTIAILLQFLKQDLGNVEIFGLGLNSKHNLIKIKEKIGFLPDADLPKLQSMRFLRHSARYYGLSGQRLIERIQEILKMLNATSFANRNTASLSRGQKTRIKIANALINDPELIIADEPTTGLDPVSRSQFLDLITNLVKKEKKTVFLSSHVIGEVEKVSTNLLILSNGRVVSQGSLAEITKNLPVSNRYLVAVDEISIDQLKDLPGVKDVQQHSPGRYAVFTSEDEPNSPVFLKELTNSPYKLNYFSRDNVALENIFFEVVKEEEK